MKIIQVLLLLLMSLNSYSATNEQWLENLDLSTYKNKVVYLDFWASWCGPCRKSFPWLNSIQKKYDDKGLVVIGINLDSEFKNAQDFLKTVPAEFTLFSDPDATWADKYKLIGMPSSFVLDGNGEIRHRHVGFKKVSIDDYEESIKSLLAELK
jgi:cytochrome c biogenesis protein CcmG/thiol:disulfide interchange protein DsbE